MIKANIITKDTENNSFVFPKSEEIIISKSDLQIQLEKYKECINSVISIFDVLAIISLWLPIFTTDFKGILNLQAVEIKAGYSVFALIVSFIIILPRIKYIFKKNRVSSNSEEMASKILNRCQSKPKNK